MPVVTGASFQTTLALPMRLLDALLDGSIFFSFDRSGFVRHQRGFGPADLVVSMQGRACLVTGANSGLGLATARALAERGATVHMLCRDELRGAFASASPIVWLESLVDRAAPALDVEAIRARGEFSAEVLALADRLAADPDELAAFVRTHAAGLAAGSTGRQVRDLPADDDDAVLREALAGVLDRLETTEPA